MKAQFPKMIVNSAFRIGTKGSKHHIGIAADIQIPGWSNYDAYDMSMWLAANLPIDAMLLEYKDFGTKLPWVHISYNDSSYNGWTGNRGIFQTYFNHKKYSNGLILRGAPPTPQAGESGGISGFSYFSVMTPEEAAYYNFQGTDGGPPNPFPEPDFQDIQSRR
jgi:hypothetical protein